MGHKIARPLALILVGSWLCFHALGQDRRFHPDEALFSTFARAAALDGKWMMPGSLDKPPLAIYANALSQIFLGDSEFAARLPGALAGPITLAAIHALAKRIYGGTVPLFALFFAAFGPFFSAYSATAFTDGVMMMFMSLCLWLATCQRWGWAGIALGLAFASKQQALFYFPLALALAWATSEASFLRRALRLGAGFSGPALGVWLWDQARGETSIFALAAANNDPGRLIRANEILPRLSAWLNYGQYLLGPGALTAALFMIGLALLLARVRRQRRRRAVLIDLLWLICILCYGLAHWLIAFNIYDRYLLPLVPFMALLAARGVAEVTTRARWPATAAVLVLAALMLSTAIAASEGRTPINARAEQYAGIDRLASYLNTLPTATVIYDRWLGWQLDYYLGPWHDKRRVYYPTPDDLVKGALALDESGARYFPAPHDQPAGPWLQALAEAGFAVDCAYDSPQFVVYRLTPPGAVRGAANAEGALQNRLVQCGGAAR